MSVLSHRLHRTAFALRRPIREGRLYALLDATGFAALADRLEAAGMEHSSLFYGDDAVMMRGEAPFLVSLPRADLPVWANLLREAEVSHAGTLWVSNVSLDELRRHWKKWLSVRIPGEEGLVLFRFFDARIALAFLSTLGPADAQAFFGPNEAMFVLEGSGMGEIRPLAAVPATRIGAGNWYHMAEGQMGAFSGVAAEAFFNRYRSYMRDIWPAETAGMDDAALTAMAEEAISTARNLGIGSSSDAIIDLSVLRLVSPQTIDNAKTYLDGVRGKVPPQGYTNVLLVVATAPMTKEEADVVFARAAYWTSYP